MTLTAKQQRFVANYLSTLNATEGAREAGYRHPNQQGPRLLVNVGIQEAIKKAMKEREKRTQVTQDLVVQGLLKEAQEATTDSARIAAWAWLGKHLGMFASENAGNTARKNAGKESIRNDRCIAAVFGSPNAYLAGDGWMLYQRRTHVAYSL